MSNNNTRQRRSLADAVITALRKAPKKARFRLTPSAPFVPFDPPRSQVELGNARLSPKLRFVRLPIADFPPSTRHWSLVTSFVLTASFFFPEPTLPRTAFMLPDPLPLRLPACVNSLRRWTLAYSSPSSNIRTRSGCSVLIFSNAVFHSSERTGRRNKLK